MLQHGPDGFGADAGNGVQNRAEILFLFKLLVVADCETVGFVADALQQEQGAGVPGKRYRVFAVGDKDFFNVL